MSHNSVRDILFIRSYPKYFIQNHYFKNIFQSLANNKGITIRYKNHNITFLFPGIGKKQKIPHKNIIHRINSGLITDIVDVGGGGALDPQLKKGDIILSSNDVPSDTMEPIKVKRRKVIKNIVKKIADKRESRFYERNILTSDRLAGKRDTRLKLFNKTRCSVVQMEHCWFLRSLAKRMSSQSLYGLYVTHIEVITDEVPDDQRFLSNMKELYFGLTCCFLFNNKYLGTIKNDFLKTWLNNEHGI